MPLRELSKLGLLGKGTAAFTLAEVMMCIAVAGVIFIGIFAGYVQSAHRAGHSQHARSVLGLAQSIQWKSPVVNEAMKHLTVVLTVDLPVSVKD